MICNICGEVIGVVIGSGLEDSATQNHYWLRHPWVVPFACQQCVNSPKGTGGHRCTAVTDGIVCPAFKGTRAVPSP